mmetsp:Transcript_25383/g.51577  ORF Transcript_25383/g.51577 Transcript_25383/m.51577 type:complete len:369 (-) Transcript_25383:1176-2282(-)
MQSTPTREPSRVGGLEVLVRRVHVLVVWRTGVHVVPVLNHARRNVILRGDRAGGRTSVEGDVLQLLDNLGDILPVAELARERQVGLADVPLAPQGRLDLLGVERLPVGGREKAMPLNARHAVGPAAQPLVGDLLEQTLDEVEQPARLPEACLLGVGVAPLAIDDELAKRVPVDRVVVRFLVLHFGGHVPLRAADRLAAAGLRIELGGHPHVHHAQVAVLVYEHVGRFQVSVEHLLRVHMRERERELRNHEAYPLLLDWPAVVRHQVLRHRMARHVLLHHVQVLRCLEAIDHPHDVGVVALDQALPLARTMQPPPPRALREDDLVEHLDRVHAAAIFLAGLQHLALVALAEDLQQLVLGNVGDLRLLGL